MPRTIPCHLTVLGCLAGAVFLPALPGFTLRAQTDTTAAADSLRQRREGNAQTMGALQIRADIGRSGRYRPSGTRSATRTPTPLREIPQAITTFSAPLMRDLNLPTVARAMEYVPGIVMGQGEGHRDAPTIRGQSTTADFFVDGMRDDAQYYRDTYNVAQLDALKGANAAIFGRGGGGGVINRVMKQAEFTPVRSGRLESASWDQRRFTLDVGQRVTARTAARLNLLHEAGDGFRQHFAYERNGINPTATLLAGPVLVHVGAEHFTDRRTIDRGLPSFNGAPAPLDARVFVGNPAVNPSSLTAQQGYAMTTWSVRPGVEVRQHLRAVRYDKFYQNTFASSALNAARTQFAISGYNATADRRSLFSQTDLVWQGARGWVSHTLLAGAELSRQQTDNRRETGYFNNSATTYTVSAQAPTVAVPVTWRPSATDANNRATAAVGAWYLQEQLALGPYVRLLGGVRQDRVAMRVDDRRSATRLERVDHLLSPRGAVILTPTRALSLYGSVSTSYLPSSGDQFAALTATTQTLRPEAFRNREAGVKWAVRPALDLTAAWFVLDRTNTTAPDPLDATRLVQTGGQQTRGAELGVQGAVTPRWEVMGGVAVQQATITSRTSAARAGATVPLVPRTTASLWNKVQATRRTAFSLGVVHQGDRYAAIDNTVRLPAFTRLDAGLFLTLPAGLTTQLHVENLLDTRYTATSHGNNNIMPGAGRSLRVTLAY